MSTSKADLTYLFKVMYTHSGSEQRTKKMINRMTIKTTDIIVKNNCGVLCMWRHNIILSVARCLCERRVSYFFIYLICNHGCFNPAAAFIGLLCVGLRLHQAGVGRPETETKDVEVCVYTACQYSISHIL